MEYSLERGHRTSAPCEKVFGANVQLWKCSILTGATIENTALANVNVLRWRDNERTGDVGTQHNTAIDVLH